MNKKLVVLPVTMMLVGTTIGTVSDANACACDTSKTRWHIGMDVGMMQYKQERKQRVHPTYEEVNKAMEMMNDTCTKAKNTALLLANGGDDSNRHDMRQRLGVENNNINNADSANTVKDIVKDLLEEANCENIDNMINTYIPSNDANTAKTQAKKFLKENILYMDWIKLTKEISDFDIIRDFANNRLTARQASINAFKAKMQSYMKTNNKESKDLLSGEALQEFDKKFIPELKAFIEDVKAFKAQKDINALRTRYEFQTYLENNWYGQGDNPEQDAFEAMYKEIFDSESKFVELLNKTEVARQETEKVSSGRMRSPIVELNFGVTRQFGKGVLGAEVLIGTNFKEWKKKKTDVYKQNRMPVYGAGIIRAGFVIADTAEVYALGGMRFTKSTPIVGGGIRFNSKTKSYFFKVEYQKTLGKKKYPRSDAVKIGFGWKIN